MAIERILVIIRRANGDVLLASPLIARLHEHYGAPTIDVLVNDDTAAIARALPYVSNVHVYSQQWRHLRGVRRIQAPLALFRRLFRQYDLAISLTTTDSSVLLALLSGRRSISAIDDQGHKNWWKRWLLNGSYRLERLQHTVRTNLEPLRLLSIPAGHVRVAAVYSEQAAEQVRGKLQQVGCDASRFIIFHPSAQYSYKVYPRALRHALLGKLATLGVPIVITGGATAIDRQIKASLPRLPNNVFDLIGETSLEEYIALSDMALAYVGGDTLNMHIAAAQDKRIFAIFGPTLVSAWSPWSNRLQCNTTVSQPVQTYGNITVFQADMPCVPCNQAGCDNLHGDSECLKHIDPGSIFAEVSSWLATSAQGHNIEN